MATTWALLFVFSAAIHLVFLVSIFDIYFRSPLVHGMSPQRSPDPPPARRLVLFVADGLRADKFFGLHVKDLMRENKVIELSANVTEPYLRSLCATVGNCGVSHAHVPTESRPGHVALIAGFYEDVSAVTKGWKENPVEFDSFFNESRYTWSWGSPDILPMFAKGASDNHVFVDTYDPEYENFATSNSSALDLWVFEKFKNFLTRADTNSTLKEMMMMDGVVFFLHLLGLDTVGHGKKPNSPEYQENLRLVDANIKDVVEKVEEFYGHDGLTSYVFTSDHGMTDWGSHGSGSVEETMTPIVCWGAGVNPSQSNSPFISDGPVENDHGGYLMQLSHINQVDVAPLMAALIGVPFPMNSVARCFSCIVKLFGIS